MKPALLLPLAPALLAAQTFEVASVKPASPDRGGGRIVVGMTGREGGPGTSDPTRVRYAVIDMRFLVSEAYGQRGLKIVGPGWIDDSFYQLDATMPVGTTVAQFRIMLQHLMADRFKLVCHREEKEVRGYTLVVAKNGAKLKQSDLEPPPPGATPPPRPRDLPAGPDGYKVPPRRLGSFVEDRGDRERITFQGITVDSFAYSLGGPAGGPVTDATGLNGRYDFTLTFSKPAPPVTPGTDATDVPPDLFRALEAQLGLKLEPKKAAAVQLIIDHVEKVPTEN